MKKFTTSIVICLLLFVVNHANADLTLTAVDGDWSNPVGDGTSTVQYLTVSGIGYGNGTQDQIRWGDPVDNDKSGLGFTGVAGDGTTSTFDIGNAFQIGQLAHFNNPIWSGSEITSADLTVDLDFLGAAGTKSFTFTLLINETPNTSDAAASADIISFPSSYTDETFDIGGMLYTLQLLGFGNNPSSPLSYFSSPEGGINETLLWGQIVPVPVPGALLLGMLGLSVAGVKLRKRA